MGSFLGAVAFSFPYSTEPIAGIQPIQQMLGLLDQKMRRRHSKELPVLPRAKAILPAESPSHLSSTTNFKNLRQELRSLSCCFRSLF